MKKALFLFLMLLPSLATFANKDKEDDNFIPTYNKENKNYEYLTVVNLEDSTIKGATAYDGVLNYIYRNLQTNKDKVITNNDKTEITFDCSLKATPMNGFGWSIQTANYTFKVDIRFKDGKVRLYCDNFTYDAIMNGSTGQEVYSLTWDKMKNNKNGKKIKQELNDLLLTMTKEMKDSAEGKNQKQDNNW